MNPFPAFNNFPHLFSAFLTFFPPLSTNYVSQPCLIIWSLVQSNVSRQNDSSKILNIIYN